VRKAPMSTFPAEMVRLGSIWMLKVVAAMVVLSNKSRTYDNCNEWVLELLVRKLCVHVDAGQPTSIAGM
jgi:hypothetical protein